MLRSELLRQEGMLLLNDLHILFNRLELSKVVVRLLLSIIVTSLGSLKLFFKIFFLLFDLVELSLGTFIHDIDSLCSSKIGIKVSPRLKCLIFKLINLLFNLLLLFQSLIQSKLQIRFLIINLINISL